APRIFGIDGKAVRTVDVFGQVHLLPSFGAIGRAIKRAVEFVADFAALAAARDDEIKRAIAGLRQAPCEGFVLGKSVVLQRPTCAAIVGTEDAATEAGYEQALAVEKDMRRGGWRHSVRHRFPSLAAVVASCNAAAV